MHILACLMLSLSLVHPMQATPPAAPNPMDLSREMKLFLDRKVDQGLMPTERLQALVSAVFHDSELNFTYAPETRTAIETFTHRNGNCLSFTLLFISMARYLNLDAKFREVEIAPVWTKAGAFENLNLHINAGVFIGGQAFAVDVFPAVTPIEIGGRVVSDERGIAHFYNNKGVDELGRGNLDLAVSYLREALQFDPTTVCVWINLGVAARQAGQLAEAEKYYRKALELDPQNCPAMSNLAGICEQTGRIKEATQYQAKVKQFREKNPYYHYDLGLQAFEEGRYEEAVAHYRKALKLKSGEHNFYFAMARVYAQMGQQAEVVKNLQLAEKYASDPLNKARYAEKLELLKGMQGKGAPQIP
jgi:tetratricopeptide (TPR) repeat protein